MQAQTTTVYCDNHPSAAATARCLVCGTALCEECVAVRDSSQFCSLHASEDASKSTALSRPDFVTRAIAYVTDGAILFGVGAIMLSIVMSLLRPAMSFDMTLLLHLLLFTAALALYTTYFTYRDGQTPGKALFRLRVRDVEGKPISAGRAFLRWVGYFLSTITLFAGFLVAIKDPNKQAWHDKLARTIVVGPSLGAGEKLQAIGLLTVALAVEALYALFTASVR